LRVDLRVLRLLRDDARVPPDSRVAAGGRRAEGAGRTPAHLRGPAPAPRHRDRLTVATTAPPDHASGPDHAGTRRVARQPSSRPDHTSGGACHRRRGRNGASPRAEWRTPRSGVDTRGPQAPSLAPLTPSPA